ncbi:DUF418 domain-containing protein [Variovorax sp. DAIF25]|uniref:DUF418 domain-containing protein n=1 Tax=Variovorax sp. DAIF25 TaxID=3080983 RepID=UPI003D6BB80B
MDEAEAPSSSLAPHAPHAPQRQTTVDALRGFALLGILVVNIATFASTYYGMGLPDPLANSLPERLAVFVRTFVFETKFYLLFSFLFGYSFLLQKEAAQRAGRAFAPRMARRLLGLWLLGVAHGVLLYQGDILTTYGVIGVVLLMLHRRGDRFLLSAGVALVLGTALLWAAFSLLLSFALGGGPMDLRSAYAEAVSALAAYRGTPMTVIVQHLRELSQIWWLTALVQAPTALAMFFAGFVAGRHALLADTGAHLPLFRRLLAWGLVVGLPGAAFYAQSALRVDGSVRDFLGLSATLLTAPFLSAAYACALVLLFRTPRGRVLERWLAPAGRMALSNYLLQSAVCAWLFLAYGLRWIGATPPLAAMGIAFAIFGCQLPLSRWWMGRFAYGPVEWLLRAFTNLALPSMRRASTHCTDA